MSGMISIAQLESRLRDNPKSLLFAHLADLYLRDGRIDDAVHLCQEGLKHSAAYVTGHYILAKAYLAQGQNDKAEECLKTVLTHDRQFLAAHKILGDLMAREGWENKAVIHYRDLLTLDPLESEAREMLESMAPDEEFMGDFASHEIGPELLDLEPLSPPTPQPPEETWEEELSLTRPGRDLPEPAESPVESELPLEPSLDDDLAMLDPAPAEPDTHDLALDEAALDIAESHSEPRPKPAPPRPAEPEEEETWPGPTTPSLADAFDALEKETRETESPEIPMASGIELDLDLDDLDALSDLSFPETLPAEEAVSGGAETPTFPSLDDLGLHDPSRDDSFVSLGTKADISMEIDQDLASPSATVPSAASRQSEKAETPFADSKETAEPIPDQAMSETASSDDSADDAIAPDERWNLDSPSAAGTPVSLDLDEIAEWPELSLPDTVDDDQTPWGAEEPLAQEPEPDEPSPSQAEPEKAPLFHESDFEIDFSEASLGRGALFADEEAHKPAPEEDDAPRVSGHDDDSPKIISPTLGEIYAAQGQYAKAIRVYETLLEKSPDEAKYRQKIAELKKKLEEE